MKSILFKWNSHITIPAEEKHQGIIKKIVRCSNFEFYVWGTSFVIVDKFLNPLQAA